MLRHLTQPTVLALALCACSDSAVSDQVALYLDGSAERRLSLREVAIEPAENVRNARVDAVGRVSIERVDRSKALTVTVPGLCPVHVAPGAQVAASALRPVLDLGGDRIGIGFGVRFSVQARHNCLDQDRGQITWRQLEGPLLSELQVSDAGFQLSARSARFADVHPEPMTGGLVPISPRTQARVVLEARWQGQRAPAATRILTLTAAGRSTGLSSVAVSQPLVLAGEGWQVQARPAGGHAAPQSMDGLTFFAADAPGSWTLSQHSDTTLKLQALTHDATPYDCGRAECHASLSEHTASSAMSHALELPLNAAADSAAVSCMLDCHVLGERGLSDGGFQAVSARLGFTWNEHTRWQDLPQALRRLGAVRCSACHGPGAIPPPEQRSAILRSDVCASCHDAPPRYVHVSQWRSGRMASSDRDIATRQAPCARCHTTAGFLAHAGARKLSEDCAHAEPAGIACAACHAPHSADRGPRLLRNVTAVADIADELFAEPSDGLCRACHAPLPAQAEAAAPSGALWAAQIAVPAKQGAGWERMTSRSVHERVPRGCIGCHGGAALAQGAVDHSFRADPRVCTSCHTDDALSAGRAAAEELRSRALALSRALEPLCQHSAASSPHAQPEGCSSRALERARYEVSVVLDDAAAVFHNAELSRQLLADAAQQLSDHSEL